VNELELVSVLREQGFLVKTVQLSLMSFAETAKVLRSAALVVGPHG